VKALAKDTTTGVNRTGMEANPAHAAGMLEVPSLTEPSSGRGEDTLDDLRKKAIGLRGRVGTMPDATPPDHALLLDKLGARIAFERAGVRLYDALIVKARSGAANGGPSAADLQHIRDEEHEHLGIVSDAVRSLGGDPTVLTPCANLEIVAGKGLLEIASDPRTTVAECLHAVLIAELADNDAWDTLIEVAGAAGADELVTRFAKAREQEAEHLEKVRAWIGEDVRSRS
jgi:rubrerythrin